MNTRTGQYNVDLCPRLTRRHSSVGPCQGLMVALGQVRTSKFLFLWYHSSKNSCTYVCSGRHGNSGTVISAVTPHVPVYFWPNRHSFGDIELNFVFYHELNTDN